MKKEIKKRVCFIYPLSIFVCLLSLSLWSTAFAATYNSSTGELRLPAVFDGEKTYTDAVITLNSNGTYSLAGTEATLPFTCENNFNDATLGLITEGMSVADINSTLGCDWVALETDIDNFSRSYSWKDTQCTEITISPVLKEGDSLSKLILYNNICELNSGVSRVYDLTSERFTVNTIIIDNASVTTPDTILKFNPQAERWELVSVEIANLRTPPLVCDLFDENTLPTKLSSVTTLADVENVLGCQWTFRINADSDIVGDNFLFSDHECSSISLSMTNQQQISNLSTRYSKVGCGL